MKRLLGPGACMFGLSPKPMSLTVDIDFGIKECQVWTMLQKTNYEMFRCCSNFSKNTHHTVQSHLKRWIQISQESPYQWGYLRLNIWSVVGALWVTWATDCPTLPLNFCYQGSGRLGTGDGHTNEIAHVSWRLEKFEMFLNPSRKKNLQE